MIGLRLIEIRDVLKVTRMERIDDLDIPTLRFYGEDFGNAYEVYINDTKSPDVFVESDTKLLAQIPNSQVDQIFRSVMVTSTVFTRTTEKSQIEFRLLPHIAAVSGVERLANDFIKALLQSPSTFSDVGGALLKSLRKSTDPQSLTADFHRSVEATAKQFISRQAMNPTLPLDEQLQTAKLLESRYDVGKRAVVGTIKIKNRLGKSSVVGLGL